MKNLSMEERDQVRSLCNNILYDLNGIETSLRSASNWGLLDIFGGNLLSSVLKHNRLGDSQRKLNDINIDLNKLKNLIKDTFISTDINVETSSTLRFMDIAFDNIFSDIMAQSSIEESKNKIYQLRREIQYILDRLNLE